MTNYNAASYIREAIESILWQTLRDFELIIVDDGSTDTSWDIIQKYSKQDTRIRCYKNDKNYWISSTRNRLLDLAQGEYIAWLDSDDRARSDRLEKQIQFLETHPEYGIVGSWMTIIDARGNEKGVREAPLGDIEIRKSFYFRTPVSLVSQMMVKKYREQIGYFQETLESAEDLDFLLRACQYCKLANIPENLTQYRIHGKNISIRKQKKQIQNTLLVRKNIEKLGYKMNWFARYIQYITWLMQYLPPRFVISIFYQSIKIMRYEKKTHVDYKK